MNTDEIVFEAVSDMEGERIDKCISGYLDSLSRSYIQKIIKDGNVFVNDTAVKANYKVRVEDQIRFTIPKSVEPDIPAQNIALDILYEDSVLYHCRGELSGINGVMRPGIVHRIDKDTTGSLIICKNDTAHNAIAALLKEHDITRKYRAIVFGNIKEDNGTICAPIGRHPTDRKKMAVNEKNGKHAVTHYNVLERFCGYTYIECQLETGRTHQIRVHLASIGHPLLGDDVYTKQKAPFRLEGQVLHAMTIGFVHPTLNKYMEFEAPLPDYFTSLLKKLRQIS